MRIKQSVFLEKYIFSAVFAVVLCGCVSTPVASQKPAALPVDRVSENTAASRRMAFRNALGTREIHGVVVYPGSWHEYSSSSVIAKAAAYGFNRIYFVITSEAELDDKLRELVSDAAKAGIASHIVLRERDFVKYPRGNAFVRSFKPEYPQIPGAGKLVQDFNDSLEEGKGGISGITVLIEPHRLNSREQYSGASGSCFIWQEDTFGAGLDNDMLMKKSLANAAEVAKLKIPFTPAIADFYHEWSVDGKLTQGRISDIEKLSETGSVLLLSSANKPGMIAESMKNEFLACKCGITPVILVADHLSVDSVKFRRRTFSDFLRGVSYGRDKMVNKKQCRGFITGPLRALEYMCYEKE